MQLLIKGKVHAKTKILTLFFHTDAATNLYKVNGHVGCLDILHNILLCSSEEKEVIQILNKNGGSIFSLG